jgi:hypothetical protein
MFFVNIHLYTKILPCTAILIAFTLIFAPLALETSSDAFAKKYKKSDNNKATQKTTQSQSKSQSSSVSSGGDTVKSGQNFNFQKKVNTGSNSVTQN